MNLNEWLDGQPGRSTWLAEQLSVTKAAVSQWRDSGVPLYRIPRVAELTNNEVTEAEMLTAAMQASLARKEEAA